MSDLIMQQIETRMAQKGIDLNLLSDQELSLVAERFLGDAPPGHLPRETVISTLQGQEPIQQWAMGIKSRVAAAAAEKMTDHALVLAHHLYRLFLMKKVLMLLIFQINLAHL